jgi:hypothetical protein
LLQFIFIFIFLVRAGPRAEINSHSDMIDVGSKKLRTGEMLNVADELLMVLCRGKQMLKANVCVAEMLSHLLSQSLRQIEPDVLLVTTVTL